MSKARKLILTVAALAALAVGGAAFAQAQGSSSSAPAPIHGGSTEADSPGDSDGGQAAERSEKGGPADSVEASDGDGEVQGD
jgi:hypothetical protein